MTNKISLEEKIDTIAYEEAVGLVKKEVEHALVHSPYIIREYLTHLSLSQGKYIRAVSVITCAENEDGRLHPDAVKAAAAIEIIHLATLVHDDIIDDADLRRGKATLQKKYGKRTAVICGDYLLSLALKMLSSVSNKKDYADLEFSDYIRKLCLGELYQHMNNHNINLSIFRYLRIISGKTAALFEASFLAGAVVAGADDWEVKNYRQIGYYVGMIFQLMDDCIDFDTTIEVANKPVQSDYENGVITLPLIHAFENIPEFKQEASQRKVARSEIDAAVARTGGLTFTKMVARKYYDKAMRRLDELELTESKRARIVAILDKASRRS